MAGTQAMMDDGSRYLGYDGCIVGGTRPTNVNVVVGTRSMVDRASTGAIRSIVDLPGTLAMTVDCGVLIRTIGITWLVHCATEGYGGGTHSTVVYI